MPNLPSEQCGTEQPPIIASSPEDQQSDRRVNPFVRLLASLGAVGLIAACQAQQDQAPATHDLLHDLNPSTAAPAVVAVTKPAPGTIFFFGDSITARYGLNSEAPNGEGWWAEVAAETGLTPITSAISGTGFIRRSRGCTAPTFGERLAKPKEEKLVEGDGITVVEVGRNDYHECVNGNSVPTTPHDVEESSERFFKAVLRLHKDPE